MPTETEQASGVAASQSPLTDSLTRSQIRRALSMWTVEGCTSTVQSTLTTGAFQTGFALYLGCSSFVIGALAAIPAFAGLLQLVSSYFAQRYGNRGQIVAWFSLASRLSWLPMLLIPFVLPRSAWVSAFLILTLAASALGNVAGPLWTAWITDLVPSDNRGRYFGQRNMYAGLTGMLVSILGGAFLDAATKRHTFAEPTAFAVIFAVACVFSFPSFWVCLHSPDPGATRPEKSRSAPDGGMLKFYAAPFADVGFRRIMVFLAGVVVSQSIAAQFFTVYGLQYLALDYTALNLLNAVASLSSLAAMPLLGYLADKYGNRPILMLSIVLVVLPPLLWIVAAPDGIAGLWAGHGAALRVSYTKLDIILLNLISGIGWAGVGLTQFNMMVGAAPSSRRTVYVSAVAAVSGLAGGVAPLLGGIIVQGLSHFAFSAHGLIRSPYHVLFILTAITRAACLLLLRPVEEHGSNSARYVLGQLKATKPIGSITSIQKLSRGSSAPVRQQAADELARLKTPLAVEELVAAMDDVALPVRAAAAAALGEIGDRRALTSLLRKLSDPAAGIENAAATALGKIGDKAAFPALAAAAQLGPLPRRLAAVEALGRVADPRVVDALSSLLSDYAVRLPALRALAELEDPASVPTLLAMLSEERDPTSLAVLADALGRIGGPDAALPLLAALDNTLSPTVRREILNAVGSTVGGRDAFYPFLALEPYARDETVGKILLNIQRRFRSRAARTGTTPRRSTSPRRSMSPRITARAKQALEAYVLGDPVCCLQRLEQIGVLAEQSAPGGPISPALQALRALQARAAASPPSPEEVLLAVFLVRQITSGIGPGAL